MVEAGTPARFVYAFLKTGIMPMIEEGYRAADPADRARYDKAIEDYEESEPTSPLRSPPRATGRTPNRHHAANRFPGPFE
jgi:hypothetical protein